MSVNHLLAALVTELEEGDVPTPLTQSLTLAAVWCDLARLAGEEPPAAVAAAVLDERITPATASRWPPEAADRAGT